MYRLTTALYIAFCMHSFNKVGHFVKEKTVKENPFPGNRFIESGILLLIMLIMTKTPHEYIRVQTGVFRHFCPSFYFLTSFLEEKGLNNS